MQCKDTYRRRYGRLHIYMNIYPAIWPKHARTSDLKDSATRLVALVSAFPKHQQAQVDDDRSLSPAEKIHAPKPVHCLVIQTLFAALGSVAHRVVLLP
jgi:hypothetical protein